MRFGFGRYSWSLAGLLLAIVAGVTSAGAGTVTGTVRNGTTGKPGAGVDILLIQLQGTMQTVASTKTDADGHYKLDNPSLGTAPMLLRAVYRGVNYHEPATPGKTTIDIDVYEPTDKPSAFAVTAHAIILQPNGSDLEVGEVYNVQNKTQPPLAYYKADGNFLFSLPPGAQLTDVSAIGASGMPVVQTTIDKGNNKEAIAFPFRPGDSGIRLAYKMSYPGNETKLSVTSPYTAARLAIFAPPTVHVLADGFSPAGQDQGFQVYMRESVAANTPVAITVSGTAPPPPAAADAPGGDDSQNPSVNSRAESGGGAPVATATTLPARLDSLKWVVVSGFAALFALGLIFLWRRPETVGEDNGEPAVEPRRSKASSLKGARGKVNREVNANLDEMKEGLFRLELRRQAGTIPEEEYAREHARMQKMLRDLVKG